jgi:2,3-diaminopropionate biosynthesis protein SbnB
MLYLNEEHIRALGTHWPRAIDAIEGAVRAHDAGHSAQPLKPYLRYGDPRNRIIAMPAYVGGDVGRAGIKWIASFPSNLERGMPRAHSVVILNDASNGKPTAIVNGASLSVIRTAAVSGLVIRGALAVRPRRASVRLGITGWGPIGRSHVAMCESLLGDALAETRVFDLRRPDSGSLAGFMRPVYAVDSWQDAYDDADIFITCTVSNAPYIDRAPKPGSLQLNVSLRDYRPSILQHVKGGIVVDDWQEVCRENTDVEAMHREHGLGPADVFTLADVVVRDRLRDVPGTTPVMFNPMGMAIFDMAIADHYVKAAGARGVGVALD